MSAAFTIGDTAEQAGSAIAIHCLNDLVTSKTQCESVAILKSALQDLQLVLHHRASAGFAKTLVPLILRGMKVEAAESTKPNCADCVCHLLEVAP
jgi:hypothetical protein